MDGITKIAVVKAGPVNGPPNNALYLIRQTCSDGSGGEIIVDYTELVQLHLQIQAMVNAERLLEE